MYHEGFVFHATPDTCAPKEAELIGPWVAAATYASFSGRSEPNFLKASADKVMKPFSSTLGAASAGGCGYFFPSSPTCSPSSGANAATYTRPTTLGSTPASVMTTPPQECPTRISGPFTRAS